MFPLTVHYCALLLLFDPTNTCDRRDSDVTQAALGLAHAAGPCRSCCGVCPLFCFENAGKQLSKGQRMRTRQHGERHQHAGGRHLHRGQRPEEDRARVRAEAIPPKQTIRGMPRPFRDLSHRRRQGGCVYQARGATQGRRRGGRRWLRPARLATTAHREVAGPSKAFKARKAACRDGPSVACRCATKLAEKQKLGSASARRAAASGGGPSA